MGKWGGGGGGGGGRRGNHRSKSIILSFFTIKGVLCFVLPAKTKPYNKSRFTLAVEIMLVLRVMICSIAKCSLCH